MTDAGGGGNRADAAPHVYRVTKYDPADRDEHGHYVGAEGVFSDHGRVEAAYLAAVVAFAEDSGVTTVAIREPEIVGLAHFDVEPPVEGYGLAGLSGYADESHPLATAVLPDNDGVLRARWTP